MFPLHETTQRNLCRIAFVALCLVPTALAALYGLRLQMPGHRAAVASELARQTGVDVSLDELVHPRPGETRLMNVRLLDPETGREIAHLRELEIATTGEHVVVHAAQPKVDARHFALVWRRLADGLLAAGRGPKKTFELRAADLTITSPDAEAQTLRRVQLLVTRNEDGATAELRYSVAGVVMTEPALLRVARHRSDSGEFSHELAWHTGGAALPVAPWCEPFPWLTHLGANCQFRGELTAVAAPCGWRGELGGELSHIDLEALVSQQFAHKLSGQGRAIVEQLHFDRGRITSARGRMEAGPGVVGQSLIEAAVEHLGWTKTDDSSGSRSSDTLQRYARLAVGFSLDGQQLQLRGECSDAKEQTAIVIGDAGYRTAAEHTISPIALVRTLSPASDHQVPATEATRMLVQVLPLPPEESQQELPRAHVRGP
jgi:hypothetical protein